MNEGYRFLDSVDVPCKTKKFDKTLAVYQVDFNEAEKLEAIKSYYEELNEGGLGEFWRKSGIAQEELMKAKGLKQYVLTQLGLEEGLQKDAPVMQVYDVSIMNGLVFVLIYSSMREEK